VTFTLSFSSFEALLFVFLPFEVKSFVCQQDYALKVFALGLKMSDYKKKNVTRGGGVRKVEKSVTYYLKGSLFMDYFLCIAY
jgi:hypothetical protein